MNTPISQARQQLYRKVVITISVVVPLVVVILFNVKVEGYNFSFLPPIYASTNGLTALVLIMALIAIKRGKRALHEKLMKTALILSAFFLVLYILYHITSEPTKYGGEGGLKYFYYAILISHIALSVIIIPLVLFTYLKAITRNFEQHRRLARITFPIWLYVAITGVLVYLLISPYYAH